MPDLRKWIDRFESWMIAVTFAEAGERDMALHFLNKKPLKKSMVSRARKRVDERPVLRA